MGSDTHQHDSNVPTAESSAALQTPDSRAWIMNPVASSQVALLGESLCHHLNSIGCVPEDLKWVWTSSMVAVNTKQTCVTSLDHTWVTWISDGDDEVGKYSILGTDTRLLLTLILRRKADSHLCSTISYSAHMLPSVQSSETCVRACNLID